MYLMGPEEAEAAARVIKSGEMFRYRQGAPSEADLFEREWAEKIGVPHAIVMTSGTASLICGLAGLGIGPGDEVIVPAYTFISTALAPLAVGAVPVLAEIDDTLTIDPDDVTRKITDRTRAIIPVHMCGLPCNMEALQKIASAHGIKILEDACQADGGSYRGRRLGSIGHAGAFSFNHFKIISAGEGGALVTSDPEVYERALIEHDGGCVFFRTDGRELTTPMFAGMNFRISEVLTAMLRVQLTRLDHILATLRSEKRATVELLEGVGGCNFVPCNDRDGECGLYLMIRFDTESLARAFAKSVTDRGVTATLPIDTGRHVYSNWEAIMKQRGAHLPARDPFGQARLRYSPDMCPRTTAVLSRTVYVPMSAKEEDGRVERISTAVKAALGA